jgi:hypothetical protein
LRCLRSIHGSSASLAISEHTWSRNIKIRTRRP